MIDQTDLSKDFVVHDLNLTPILCDSDKEDLTTLLNSHKQLLKMEPNNKCMWLYIIPVNILKSTSLKKNANQSPKFLVF